MKTLTEFNAIALKNAKAKWDEARQAAKAASSAPAAVAQAAAPTETPAGDAAEASADGEANPAAEAAPAVEVAAPVAAVDPEEAQTQAFAGLMGIEGDKLTWMRGALQVYSRRADHLKRVVVMELKEGEKAPAGAQTIGALTFVAEFFPLPAGQERSNRDQDARGGRDAGRGGRGDKRGGRGGRDGGRDGGGRGPKRDGESGGREGRAPRRDSRGDGAMAATRPPGAGAPGKMIITAPRPDFVAPGSDKKPARARRPRGARGPKREGAPAADGVTAGSGGATTRPPRAPRPPREPKAPREEVKPTGISVLTPRLKAHYEEQARTAQAEKVAKIQAVMAAAGQATPAASPSPVSGSGSASESN